MLRRRARACSAAPPRASSCPAPRRVLAFDSSARRARRAARARRHRLSRHLRRRPLHPARSHRRPWRARPAPRPPRHRRRAPRPSCGNAIPLRAAGATGYAVLDPGRRHAPRLRRHLRRQRRCGSCSTRLDRQLCAAAAKSCSRASTASRSPSPSRRPSCGKRACASPPSGAEADLRRRARPDRARRALARRPDHASRDRATEAGIAYRTAFTDPLA